MDEATSTYRNTYGRTLTSIFGENVLKYDVDDYRKIHPDDIHTIAEALVVTTEAMKDKRAISRNLDLAETFAEMLDMWKIKQKEHMQHSRANLPERKLPYTPKSDYEVMAKDIRQRVELRASSCGI